MIYAIKTFCFLGLAIAISIGLAYAADDISVKVEVDKAFATIGDEINLRVSVSHHPDIQVLQITAENLSDFEIKKTTDFSTKENSKILEGKNYVLTTYLLGEYVVRPFTIQYRTKNGDVKELQSNNLYVTMESVDKSKDTKTDIRGVKGVQKLKNTVFRWLLGFLGAAAGLGIGLWFYLRKKGALSQTKPEVVLSPHEEAYLSLNQLKNSDLIRKGLIKQYFFRMSEILRTYIERRYQIRALESTTYELMRELKTLIQPDQKQLIEEVVTFCDLVKFAKYIPTALEIIQQSNQAKTVIDQTKEEVQTVVSEPIQS